MKYYDKDSIMRENINIHDNYSHYMSDMVNFEAKLNSNDEEESYDGLLKLFVGGLNYLSLQSDIKSYFETFGKVSNCTLLLDKASGKSRGFAFVTVEDPLCELKDKVLSRKHEINGKIVDVKLAVEGKKREEMLDSSKKIFVGGLDPTVTNDDLRNFFSTHGDVREAVVLFDNNRGASRCFGFVTFDSKVSVEKLVNHNKYIIKGKPVDVKQALPKALQKVQNITCQSGVDMVLNRNKNLKIKNVKSKYEDMDNPDYEMEDRNFIDMVTNPYFNSKEYYQKFSEIENAKLNNEMYNFNNYQFYDMQSQDDSKKPKKK